MWGCHIGFLLKIFAAHFFETEFIWKNLYLFNEIVCFGNIFIQIYFKYSYKSNNNMIEERTVLLLSYSIIWNMGIKVDERSFQVDLMICNGYVIDDVVFNY